MNITQFRLAFMSLYFLQMLAKVGANHKEAQKVEGCICNCWIKAQDESAAKERAQQLLLEHDWVFQDFEQVILDKNENYAEGNEGLQYFEQAQQSGCAYVFHMWEKPQVN